MHVGILFFDDFDLLDAGGPYEVFLTASRLAARTTSAPRVSTDSSLFEVVTISLDDRPVKAYGGLRVLAEHRPSSCPPLDVLVVPGAIAIERVRRQGPLLAAIRDLAQSSRLTTSVCTGSFLLATAGCLAPGDPWTTHWEDIDLLSEDLGSESAVRDARWATSGDVVTAAGLSSGIAMSLHLIDRLVGQELAQATARQIDYDWEPSGRRPDPASLD